MSMIPFPRRFGRHHPIFDQQQLNWEPFQDFHHTISTTQSHNIIPNDITNSFRIDWKETPEAHIYRLELSAGLKKHEVIVEVENGYTLRISGEMKTEKAEKTDNWQRIERRSGNFLRRISLPQNSNPDKTKASLDNGVLIVIVPKGHNLMMMPHYSKVIHVSGH